MENIRRLSEVSRLLPEFTQHGSANSSLNEIFKSLMIQMVSNCNRKKENMQIKNDHPPVGFRISAMWKVFIRLPFAAYILSYRILGFIKANSWMWLQYSCNAKWHECFKHDKSSRREITKLLEKVVFSRIGQKDVYLKIVDVPTQFFIEERRSRWKLPSNTVPIEENDCTKIDICSIEQYGDHWPCRAIKERSKLSVWNRKK